MVATGNSGKAFDCVNAPEKLSPSDIATLCFES
jgi:hypothetical protein